jgi:hypothetical protein
MPYGRKVLCLSIVVAALGLGGAASAMPTASGGAPTDSRETSAAATNFRVDTATGIDFSQGECCAFWYFGTPTDVTAPRVGAATLTTFFIQCFASSVCDPLNSQLTLTYETKQGDKLVLLGYAPNLGTSTRSDGSFVLSVNGTWSVTSGSTGRFSSYTGSGSFSLTLTQPVGSVGGNEHITLEGALDTS